MDLIRTLNLRGTKADENTLDSLMEGPVTEALNIPGNVRFGSQSSKTFSTLAGDFMKPVINYGLFK